MSNTLLCLDIPTNLTQQHWLNQWCDFGGRTIRLMEERVCVKKTCLKTVIISFVIPFGDTEMTHLASPLLLQLKLKHSIQVLK